MLAEHFQTKMASTSHCIFCFDSIAEDLLDDASIKATPKFENGKFPLFVTWNLKNGDGYQLRGCIGNFSQLDLHKGLYQYARIAAFEDSRFSPITKREFTNLQVGVSLLTDFEQAADWQDFEIGKHGIRLHYKNMSATYLPEVAKDQGWDHDETIKSLLRKAGFAGSVTNHIKSSIQLERYQSSKAYLDFDEWKKAHSV